MQCCHSNSIRRRVPRLGYTSLEPPPWLGEPSLRVTWATERRESEQHERNRRRWISLAASARLPFSCELAARASEAAIGLFSRPSAQRRRKGCVCVRHFYFSTEAERGPGWIRSGRWSPPESMAAGVAREAVTRQTRWWKRKRRLLQIGVAVAFSFCCCFRSSCGKKEKKSACSLKAELFFFLFFQRPPWSKFG